MVPGSHRTPNVIRIETACRELNINNARVRAQPLHGHGGGRRRQGWDQNFVPGRDAASMERKRKRVGSRVDAYHVGQTDVARKLYLESFSLRAQNVTSAREHTCDCFVDLMAARLDFEAW